MQVSWIDAEQIKDLLAQLTPQEPCVEEAPGMVEIHTTPEALMGDGGAAWGWGMDWVAPAIKPAPAVAEVAVAVVVEAEPPELTAEPPPEMTAEEDEEEGPAPLQDTEVEALPLSRIRDKLRAIRQHATEAGILTRVSEAVMVKPVAELPYVHAVPVAEAEVCSGVAVVSEIVSPFTASQRPAPAFVMPSGSREVRLAAFAGWARQVLHEDGGHVLVMNDDGEVLWGGEAKAGLVLSTMMAWGAAIRASAMSACEMPLVIHQPLASGNVLTVIPCETAGGMVHAAVAAPAGLTQKQAGLLRGALCAAMN